MYQYLANYLIFCNLCNLVISNPMIGSNIKLAIQGQFPYVVSLKRLNYLNDRKPEEDHVCTGTLVSKKDVLTAAHCQDEFKGYVCEVKVGNVDLSRGQSFYVEWWMSYTNWAAINRIETRTEDNDIAIVRLNECIPDAIPVAKRGFGSPNSEYYGKMVTAVGFGSTNLERASRYLQTAEFYILRHDTCEGIIEKLRGSKFPIYQSQLCAQVKPYVIMTVGNSGAPIFYKKTLIGVYKGISPNHPDYNDIRRVNVFFSTYYFKEFINDVVTNF